MIDDDRVSASALLRDVLSGDERRALLERRDDVPLRDSAICAFLLAAAPVALMLYPGVVTVLAAVLLHIRSFNCCAQMVHGTDHAGVFTRKSWDRWVGRVASALLGYTCEGHEATHRRHHQFLNTARDGDRVWCDPAAPVSAVFRGWARDVLMISALFRFFQYSAGTAQRPDADMRDGVPGRRLRRILVAYLPVAVVQLVLFAVYAMTEGPEYYVLVYVLPLVTLYPAQARLRSVAEHGFPPGETGLRADFNVRVTRSTKGSRLLRFVVAPLYYDHHYEHHALPDMPYYNAPKLRHLLEQKGVQLPCNSGYAAFLWEKWHAERASQPRPQPAR